MIIRSTRDRITINVDIDITLKFEHLKKIKDKLGVVDCAVSIRNIYPFIDLTEAIKIAREI